MNKFLFPSCVLCVLVAACDTESVHNGVPDPASTPKPDTAVTSGQDPVERQLQLDITDEMMQQSMVDHKPPHKLDTHIRPATSGIQPLDLESARSESRIKLKGEVYLDENWQQDYRQAIDGGKIDFEMKFDG